MKNNNEPTICYQCEHRADLMGDAHSCCNHPEVKKDLNSLNSIITMFAKVSRVPPRISPVALELNIQANEHGIRSGWFNWPYNFDPIWLTNCDGFKKRGENNEKHNRSPNRSGEVQSID